MPIRGGERSAEHTLAALLRGAAEFGYRARLAASPAESLARFVAERLPWLAADASGARAREIALASYDPGSVGGRLLHQAWQSASSSDVRTSAESMRSPLSTVFVSTDHGSALLPLVRLELNKSIFPASEVTARQPVSELFEAFASAVSQFGPAKVLALIQTLLTALETYAWCVPADGHSDVSIFEFARTASAIASAAAAEEQSGRGIAYNKTELLLAVGDLGGIQRFLYAVVASKAARMLRGRSLGLQLIADAIANRILAYFQLPITNLLYSGGGKLWLLMPAAAQAELLTLAEEIDVELNQCFASRLSFGIGCAVVTIGELSSATSRVWQRATDDLASRRRRRFSQIMRANYERVFDPSGGDEACRACGVLSNDLGALSSEDDDQKRLACTACRDFVKLGGLATRTGVILRLPRDAASPTNPLFTYRPQVGHEDYLLYERDPVTTSSPAGATVMWINGAPKMWGGQCGHAIWLAGLNRAVDKNGEPLDFDELAKHSDGINRLGILRMDVDSLGRTFREGFSERASLARIAALSRHLSYFFGGYLSSLLSRDEYAEKLQIIYSGGDDVFIVGAWSEIPLIAERIRRDFGRFTGGNPAWGISAGIDIMPASFPIAAAAIKAGQAEEQAKGYQRRSGKNKDAICFLNEVFGWEEFAVLSELRTTLSELFARHDPQVLPRATLRLLHAVADQARRAGDLIDASRNGGDALQVGGAVRRGKWAWQAAYGIARAASGKHRGHKLDELYQQLGSFDWRNISSSRPLLWLLKPAAEWVDLLNREAR
jgi:CRISPR-associated protein Csm1